MTNERFQKIIRILSDIRDEFKKAREEGNSHAGFLSFCIDSETKEVNFQICMGAEDVQDLFFSFFKKEPYMAVFISKALEAYVKYQSDKKDE